jgi:hypothetical protein
MEDWNKDQWQGKRKDQVDFSYKTVLGIVVITLIILFIIHIIG